MPNLSPGVISRLTAGWQRDYDRWQRRDLSTRSHVCIWADGACLQARMEPAAGGMLAVIDAMPERRKELPGCQVGLRGISHAGTRAGAKTAVHHDQTTGDPTAATARLTGVAGSGSIIPREPGSGQDKPRGRRLMRENALSVNIGRAELRGPQPHDHTIVPETICTMWDEPLLRH